MAALPLSIFAAGMIATAVGLLALLGWVLELPRLASFGADLIPMAPSTALVLLLFGVGVCLRARTPLSRRTFLVSAATGLLGVMIALLLFVLSALNIHSTVEHLGWNISGTLEGAPIGHMSQVTALCFLLAGVSFFASLSRLTIRSWRAVLASGSAGVLLGTCSIFLLAYLYGEPLLYGGTYIPPALNTVLAIAVLSLALLALTDRPSAPHGGQAHGTSRASYVFLLIFVLLAAGIVVVGWLYFRHFENHFRVETEQTLSAIADLKASELVQWRDDRLADGAIFFKNPSFSALARRFFEKPADADARRQVEDWLGGFPARHGYDQLRLMDAQGVTRLSVPAGTTPATAAADRVATEVLRSGRITFQDFFRNERDGRVYLQVMVPIFDESDAGRPLGVVGLRIDPAIYLYPSVKHWPTPSPTAETLLLRREGNAVLYLNDLRHRSNAALALIIPLSGTESPAAGAKLLQTGVAHGEDYRGVPVIAATRQVSDTPWALVAKMDVSEVSAPMRERLWFVVAMIGLLLFGSGASVGLVWRKQRIRFLLERAEFAETLRVEKMNLDAIFESSPIALFIFDEDTNIVRVNTAALVMTGGSAATLLEHRPGNALRCVHRSQDPRGCGYSTACPLCPVRNGIETLIASSGRLHGTELVMELMRDNVPRKVWLRIGAGSVQINGRRHVCVAMEDITERKKAELQVRYQANLLANVSEAIIATDRQFNVTYWNAAAELIYGWTAAEALGKHFLTFIQSRYPGESRRTIMRKIATTGSWQGELLHNRRDGTVFPVQVTTSAVKGADGRVIGHVAICRDITMQHRAEAERSRLEDQLRQSQKVEAIGSLAGGVAHDFNNLAAIILGYGEMLLGQLGPQEPAHHYVEQIVAAGRRATALTRQLLAFGRRQTLMPEVLDLNELLRNLETMLARLIGEHVEVVFKLAEDAGRIKADPGQIEQVVTNLAVNARDAMPLGGRLTIETADVEFDETRAPELASVVPGRYVMFSVADTGCGMDRETKGKIFEPFFTTKPKGKGTGLGLATVYGIVKQSNGYIWAETVPGAGTTFRICLPRTDEELVAKEVGAGAETPRGNGERILLVEDEAPLRELCASILSRLGYQVSSAQHGLEGLMLVREQGLEPDLVVSDVIMPGMSGAEMAERLQRDRPGLRVLFMSGYPDEAVAPHGVLSSGTRLIQKPFTEFALATKVWEALGKTVANPAAGTTEARLGRRVLMIDDDEQYRELVRHFCTKRGHNFIGVETAAAALAALAGSTVDVLLVDLSIPGTSGEGILQQIRAAHHSTPAIVLTGNISSADMAVLRPLGVVRALEKSSQAKPLLEAIEEEAAPTGTGMSATPN